MVSASAGVGELDPRSRQLTRHLFDRCSAAVQQSRAQYLTRPQWRELAERYCSDLAALGEHMGMSFPVVLTEPDEMPFLPSFSAVPESVKADIRSRMRTAWYVTRMRPEVMALIERLLEDGAMSPDATALPTDTPVA